MSSRADQTVPLTVNRGNPAVLAEPRCDFSKAIFASHGKSHTGTNGSRPVPRAPRRRLFLVRGRGRWASTIGSRKTGTPLTGPTRSRRPAADPYADLKASVHAACIAKLGPELFREDPAELGDHVFKAVTEELTLAESPDPRRARQLVRQLTDDILGYAARAAARR